MPINADLSQTPDSKFGAPMPGQERWFKISDGRAKNEKGADYGGQLYRVVEAQRKPDWSKEIDGNEKTFHQWSLTLEPANGNGSQPALSSSGDYQREYSPETQARVNRHTAFEGACELAASELQSGLVKPEGLAARIEALTAELLPVVEGRAVPKGENPSEVVQAPGNQTQTPDDDPPF